MLYKKARIQTGKVHSYLQHHSNDSRQICFPGIRQLLRHQNTDSSEYPKETQEKSLQVCRMEPLFQKSDQMQLLPAPAQKDSTSIQLARPEAMALQMVILH